MRNHYEILDVPRAATADQIKAAYRFQLKAFHPDKFSQGSEHARSAQERIHQIVEAYRMLSQPSSRAEYDRFLNNTSPLAIKNPNANAAEVRGRAIYVSATDELESAEELTLAELAALGYGTMTRPTAEGESDLRPAIRKQIDRCRAVVQLVGRSFGGEPPTIDPTFGRVSYTQFEAMYARQRRKAVHYVLLSDKFPADAFAQEPDELSSLQKAYRRRLQIVDPQRCPVIDNPEALRVHLRALEGILNASVAQWKNLLWVPMAAAILVLVGVWFLPTKRSPSSSKKSETKLVPNKVVAKNDTVRPEPTVAIPQQDSSPPIADSTFDLPRLARYARKAVLLILGYDANGRVTGTGSGFFISDNGRIVTNRHVINNMANVAAKTEDGAMYRITGVLADSVSLDLAVLKADAKEVRFLAIQGEALPEVGSRIAVIGSPNALEGTVSEGNVSAIRSEDNGTWIQITAPISPGSSGSPVLDGNGRVVGIATLNSGGRNQNLNFARSSRDLTALIQQISDRAKPQPIRSMSSQESRPPPSDAPSSTPQITYRVVGLPKRTPFLNIRAGPGASFAVVAAFTPKGRGITLGPGRVTNGTTVWQEVFSGSFHGWVNAEYLEPETQDIGGGHNLDNESK
jgi:S1-C subfamily serine protease